MNCVQCGAALPTRSDVCEFCGTRNDSDLRRFDVRPGEPSERICPRCAKKMTTITIEVGGVLNVERCDSCFGIFFDRYELEDLLARATAGTPGYDVDYHRLETLLGEGQRRESSVTYVACPVCSERMNRRAFGQRSGVVVDTCKEHGAWLDGGELGELLRWAKLGGMTASGGSVDLGWDAGGTTMVFEEEIDEGEGQSAAGSAAPARSPASRRSPLDALSGLGRSRRRPRHWLEILLTQLFRAIDQAIKQNRR